MAGVPAANSVLQTVHLELAMSAPSRDEVSVVIAALMKCCLELTGGG